MQCTLRQSAHCLPHKWQTVQYRDWAALTASQTQPKQSRKPQATLGAARSGPPKFQRSHEVQSSVPPKAPKPRRSRIHFSKNNATQATSLRVRLDNLVKHGMAHAGGTKQSVQCGVHCMPSPWAAVWQRRRPTLREGTPVPGTIGSIGEENKRGHQSQAVGRRAFECHHMTCRRAPSRAARSAAPCLLPNSGPHRPNIGHKRPHKPLLDLLRAVIDALYASISQV